MPSFEFTQVLDGCQLAQALELRRGALEAPAPGEELLDQRRRLLLGERRVVGAHQLIETTWQLVVFACAGSPQSHSLRILMRILGGAQGGQLPFLSAVLETMQLLGRVTLTP